MDILEYSSLRVLSSISKRLILELILLTNWMLLCEEAGTPPPTGGASWPVNEYCSRSSMSSPISVNELSEMFLSRNVEKSLFIAGVVEDSPNLISLSQLNPELTESCLELDLIALVASPPLFCHSNSESWN